MSSHLTVATRGSGGSYLFNNSSYNSFLILHYRTHKFRSIFGSFKLQMFPWLPVLPLTLIESFKAKLLEITNNKASAIYVLPLFSLSWLQPMPHFQQVGSQSCIIKALFALWYLPPQTTFLRIKGGHLASVTKNYRPHRGS